jgi:hypothetical protein
MKAISYQHSAFSLKHENQRFDLTLVDENLIQKSPLSGYTLTGVFIFRPDYLIRAYLVQDSIF